MFQPVLLLLQSHPAVAYLPKEANAIYGGPHRGHGDINKTQWPYQRYQRSLLRSSRCRVFWSANVLDDDWQG